MPPFSYNLPYKKGIFLLLIILPKKQVQNRESEFVCRFKILWGHRTSFFPLPPTTSSGGPPPTPGFIKINYDGSLIHSSVVGGSLIHEWTGKLIRVGATYYGQTSLIVAEGSTLRDGVHR